MEHETSKLPLSISTPGDARRALRELKTLDDYIHQAALRKPGTRLDRLPKASASVSEFAELNHFNLLDESDRKQMLAFCSELVEKAPTVQISFASEASQAFISKVTSWFRDNIHPLILINIGLEPTIAAGCTVRTDNHFFDFSLRQHFTDQKSLLIKGIKEPGSLK